MSDNNDWYNGVPFPEFKYIDATGYIMEEEKEEKEKGPSKEITDLLTKLDMEELEKISEYAREERRNRPHNGISKGDKFNIEIEILETQNSTIYIGREKDYITKIGDEKIELSHSQLVSMSTKLGKLL